MKEGSPAPQPGPRARTGALIVSGSFCSWSWSASCLVAGGATDVLQTVEQADERSRDTRPRPLPPSDTSVPDVGATPPTSVPAPTTFPTPFRLHRRRRRAATRPYHHRYVPRHRHRRPGRPRATAAPVSRPRVRGRRRRDGTRCRRDRRATSDPGGRPGGIDRLLANLARVASNDDVCTLRLVAARAVRRGRGRWERDGHRRRHLPGGRDAPGTATASATTARLLVRRLVPVRRHRRRRRRVGGRGSVVGPARVDQRFVNNGDDPDLRIRIPPTEPYFEAYVFVSPLARSRRGLLVADVRQDVETPACDGNEVAASSTRPDPERSRPATRDADG